MVDHGSGSGKGRVPRVVRGPGRGAGGESGRGPDPWLLEVERRLRDSGLRVTATRVNIYGKLAFLGGHRGADEVHEALVREGAAHSRTSVYSTLEVLGRVGLVMMADAGPGRALYEVSEVWHHHAVCRVCGGVSDVECVIGAKPCLESPRNWGKVDEAQVIFRGTCSSCLEAHS